MPDHFQQFSDEALIDVYQNKGDKQAVGILFKRHSLLCYTVCMKYLKDEDAANDATMQLFENLFVDLRKHEIKNFRNWFHSVARNYCLMQMRKPEYFVRLLHEEENDEPFMELGHWLHPEINSAEREHQLQTLENLLTGLQEKQQYCLRLFYLEGLSYEEVAKRSGYSLNEVKSALQNGKRNLKNSLAEKGITFLLTWMLWIQQSA